MKSKKGELLSNNLIELIVSVAVVFVLVVLLFKLFSPVFDEGDKTAESYFESLGRAVETADSGGEGSFFMMDDGDDKLEFYLAYFGSVASFGNDGRSFTRSEQGEKIICVCYRKSGNVVCNYCEDLKLSVQGGEGEKEGWVIEEGERIVIIKKEGYYEFAKI